MVKSTIKNIILMVLSVVCVVLAIRVWFGSFSFDGVFSAQPVAQVWSSPRGDLAASLIMATASLEVNWQALIQGGLQGQHIWHGLIYFAFGQLIEGGEFSRLAAPDSADGVVVSYIFPMPSNFFREHFGSRPGFLSSHFEFFESVTITPAGSNVLEFAFLSAGNYYIFSLFAPALYTGFMDYFYENAHTYHTAYHDFAWTNPIADQSLSGVSGYINFLFPSTFSQSIVNNIWTYSDGPRVARFFPNGVLEFNQMQSSVQTGGFIEGFLAAARMINQDKAFGVRMNDIVLVNYRFVPDTSFWHFYFDYAVDGMVVDIGQTFPTLAHALEIRVFGSCVVYYRRIMHLALMED